MHFFIAGEGKVDEEFVIPVTNYFFKHLQVKRYQTFGADVFFQILLHGYNYISCESSVSSYIRCSISKCSNEI